MAKARAAPAKAPAKLAPKPRAAPPPKRRAAPPPNPRAPPPKPRAVLPPAAAAAAAAAQPLERATHRGVTFRPGDHVYIVTGEAPLADEAAAAAATPEAAAAAAPEAADPAFHCPACAAPGAEGNALLECDACLAGYHLGCLDPPLAAVPAGAWACPRCVAGEAPRRPAPRAGARSARDDFLRRRDLGLARVEAIWRAPGAAGAVSLAVRWYCLPEETHAGRRRHHAAREVFLTRERQEVDVEAVQAKAAVLPPEEYHSGAGAGHDAAAADPDVDPDDVFLCEFSYDAVWQRFVRRGRWDSDSGSDGASEEEEEEAAAAAAAPRGRRRASAGSASEDEGRDATFRPGAAEADEEEGARGRRRSGGAGQRRSGGAGRRYSQGGGAGGAAEPDNAEDAAAAPRGARGASPLELARSALALATVPRSLPCREAERARVAAFVESAVCDEETGSGRCLYVSGIPGTGKTATVLDVMKSLRRRAAAGEFPRFRFAEINGLRLPSPAHVYSRLLEQLTGQRMGPTSAAAALDDLFDAAAAGGPGAAPKLHTVVLLDELDMLLSRSQKVLYNVFDWPARRNSRLSIIGVANTMDLPERLHARIGSRLAGNRLVFAPYSRPQLEAIVRSRLEACPAFDDAAVLFAARRVANSSGDVRRCLELCRRAAEVAQARLRADPAASANVTAEDLGRAVADSFATLYFRFIRECCRLERLILAAVHLEARYSGRAEATLDAVADRLAALCADNGEEAYPFAVVLERAVGLGAKRLLLCDPGRKRLGAKVALNVPDADLLLALRDDAELPWLAARLAR